MEVRAVTMNEENHMGWKLVSGVRRDVVNLFKLFANTNSVRFQDFCKVWKELSFSLIFSNRNSFTEILEFSEEVLQIVKEYLSSVYEFHTRAAAIYALYGLYFKQPIIGAAKIRFTKTEWEEAMTLVQESKAAKHFDVAFIFMKLYISGAFSFTATVRTAGMERGFRKYSQKRSSLHSKVCDVELLYRPLISEKLVDSLVKLESLYCRKKSELLGKRNLVFIDGKFAESLQEELKKYKHSVQNQYNVKSRPQPAIESGSEKTANETEDSESRVEDVGQSSQTPETSKSSKSKGNPRLGERMDNEVPMKMKKFSKRYFEMLAKKKAEFYIEKLQLENIRKESGEKKSLMELEDDTNS